MYAVFQVGGLQFRGEKGDVLKVPSTGAETGKKLDISEVLLVKDNGNVLVGTPFVEGARIQAEVLGNARGKKLRVYKYKRRTKYRLTRGHRQDYTEIKINDILIP